MPEYLSPGVYVEEVSYRSNIIEGQSTTTTGFVGPTRYGPTDLEPELLTSLADFEATYGDGTPLDYLPNNYMWHGARAFFTEGGQRLYVTRVFHPSSTTDHGVASLVGPTPVGGGVAVTVTARYPGTAGNFRVRFALVAGRNVLGGTSAAPTVNGLRPSDVVLITHAATGDTLTPYLAVWTSSTQTWSFVKAATAGASSSSSSSTSSASGGGAPPGLALSSMIPGTDKIYIVTATLTVYPPSGSTPLVWTGLALDPGHMTSGAVDSITGTFVTTDPHNPQAGRSLPIVVTTGDGTTPDGLAILRALNALTGPIGPVPAPPPGASGGASSSSSSSSAGAQPTLLGTLQGMLTPTPPSGNTVWVDITLAGGNDGARPNSDDYGGQEDSVTGAKSGLMRFEDMDDISIVAAPGSTFGLNSNVSDAVAVMGALITHAEKMRYRIAVLDACDKQTLDDVRNQRAQVDSSYAALYYPWIRIFDPVTQGPITIPPSGGVCGIYARNDINRAVYKAPANEVVNLATGFELLLNKAQQDVLNPEGINCFRFFTGRGYRLWGARTVSSDPEWVYVNVRRYFAYLEHSIDKGTQWAVFEPNGPKLWDNVRRSVSEFLLNEWQAGALQGDKPEQAFFVRCDRTTMTQQDLDSGRLVCLIGVAPLYPAEFVIFRIGQWTGSAST